MKFNIGGLVTVSCYTVVEAETEEQALKIAQSRDIAQFYIDGSWDIEECFHIEADGTPYDLSVE